ncbi:helix-turn-helix domain-containing protein [Neorhizobium sp. T786]|uniref:helix-turn-helix domain-containing protein n=1 Tax=Pseudorhizobium xiangyangii TaxID=2883104 RepID=UPI001CFF5ED0|nr:helix-turn-helix transcriptional regulator [Neorhizobium xiangyangii]MCB5201681.1 helix-turn-helix domain-containing protein [Neorhizobium xiangyangii]
MRRITHCILRILLGGNSMALENYRWFAERLRDKRMTQRALAKLLEMDPSSLSLLLHGKRRMRVEQAAEIAKLLGVPVNEVMRHGGADVREAVVTAPATLPIVGWIDGENRAKLDWNSKGSRCDIPGYPPTAVCLQWRTSQNSGSLVDGWMLVTTPPREPDAEEMLDRFCLVCIKDGDAMLKTVRRGYTPGKYTLLDMFSEPMHDVEVAWFSPVLAIRPS